MTNLYNYKSLFRLPSLRELVGGKVIAVENIFLNIPFLEEALSQIPF
jgi:hypothetical protein